ncbi:SMI1/KNR4 family protein [Archangium violaceum]|nr:SMI1/KNR4 family protein [Archangium violaceum]
MQAQLKRIGQKLTQAAGADPDFKVFGAQVHSYQLNEPLSEQELRRFEETHGIELPEEFAAFLTRLGNGGAGPFYGIHPLGTEQAIELDQIGEPSPLWPGMTKEEWDARYSQHEKDAELSGEAYRTFRAKQLAGMLNIGTQGCTYETLLMVTGEHRGKVVYVNMEEPWPLFTYEAHFLDWYERWLDEVIAGYDIHWFGKSRGGGEEKLIALYRAAEDEKTKLEALEGLLHLPRVSEGALAFLQEQCVHPSGEIRRMALQALTKMNFDRAEPLNRQALHGGNEVERLHAVQHIRWYMPDGDGRFTRELISLLPEASDEMFSFICYALDKAGIDLLPWVLPYFDHRSKEIQSQAVYQAGKSKLKAAHVADFIRVLRDPEVRVQHTALQALSGVPDPSLLPVYEELLRQHKTDDGYYMRSNVSHRLKEFGFVSAEQIEQELSPSLTQVRGMLKTLLPPRRRGRGGQVKAKRTKTRKGN